MARKVRRRAAGDLRQAMEAIQDQLNLNFLRGSSTFVETPAFAPKVQGPTLICRCPRYFLSFCSPLQSSLSQIGRTSCPLREYNSGSERGANSEADLPRRTGCSPETCGLGWQLKPYVAVAPDPAAKRGKALRLTARGMLAQQQYSRLADEIQQNWEGRFARGRFAGYGMHF